MRSSYWLVIGAIIAATLAIAFWPNPHHAATAAAPGQYPLNKSRPQWSAIQSLGLYRPRGSGLQDALPSGSGQMDAKQSCGTNRVLGRGRDACTLPTVPLGPQYTPTLLQD